MSEITGRGTGTTLVSYQIRSMRNCSVMISKMPEDEMHLRICFLHDGDMVRNAPMKLDLNFAKLLWSALNGTAQELKWEDKL